jgi:hypothetical protein
MTPYAATALSLVLLSATAAGAGTFKPDHGTFGSHPKSTIMAPPRPPAPPAAPGYRSQSQDGPFKPYKPLHVDSTRGGLDAYPKAKKPKGYISTY